MLKAFSEILIVIEVFHFQKYFLDVFILVKLDFKIT